MGDETPHYIGNELKMNLIPNDITAFLEFDEVITINALIRDKVRTITSGIAEKAKALFNWVRDEIPHSKDVSREVVTCSSTETLESGTGICFAKSHLLVSMMRCEGVPCGFCYQIFDNPLTHIPESMALHGLNAIYFKETGKWHRIDPRGNRCDIKAEFTLEKEQLAFPSMEFLDSCIYARPLNTVVTTLQNAQSITELWPVLPSVNSTQTQQSE